MHLLHVLIVVEAEVYVYILYMCSSQATDAMPYFDIHKPGQIKVANLAQREF